MKKKKKKKKVRTILSRRHSFSYQTVKERGGKKGGCLQKERKDRKKVYRPVTFFQTELERKWGERTVERGGACGRRLPCRTSMALLKWGERKKGGETYENEFHLGRERSKGEGGAECP